MTDNIVDLAHQVTKHGSIPLTMSYLRNKYHVIRASDVVKKIINHCIECTRYAQQQHTQLMGSLPSNRVSQTDRS